MEIKNWERKFEDVNFRLAAALVVLFLLAFSYFSLSGEQLPLTGDQELQIETQGEIRPGELIEANLTRNGEPVPEANISIDREVTERTLPDGTFTFLMPENGSVTVEASKGEFSVQETFHASDYERKLVEVNDISYRNTIQIGYAGVWKNNEFSQAEKLPQDAELVTGRGGEPYSQSLYKIDENGNITVTNPEEFTEEVGQPALIDYKKGENHQLSMELSATEDLEISVEINGEKRSTLVNTTGTSRTGREEAIARPVNIELGNLEAGQEYTADITFETIESGKTRTEKFSFTAE